MITFDTFEQRLTKWKEDFRLGSFTYADPATRFESAVVKHFGKVDGKVYGVYIVRKLDTREVVYIGKGGTIDQQGQFKDQDLPVRLRNSRGKISANQWFRELVEERGALVVEYLVVEAPVTPAYVEATLLQAYFVEHKRLPPKNKEW
jgi:hypothetical protein